MRTDAEIARPPVVLVLGGNGRTGRHVIERLLQCGCLVRAIVRSARALPPTWLVHPAVTLVTAELLSLRDEELQRLVRDCDAVVSCLGHDISWRGVFGPPFDLVTRATEKVRSAIVANSAGKPVRFVLMSSVSVNHPEKREAGRTLLGRIFLAVVRGVIPPARDNQRAAEFLQRRIGCADRHVEWVAVRPDTLGQGEVSPYAIHDHPVDSVFAAGHTQRSNIAHFMSELLTNGATWARWRGKFPVVVDARTPLDLSGTPAIGTTKVGARLASDEMEVVTPSTAW